MNNINNKTKRDIGYKGEEFVIDRLKTCGFYLYRKNIKYIDSEIDIVVYRYDENSQKIDIRIVEVKTRKDYCFDLINFNLIKKWRLVRKYIFKIKADIDSNFDSLKYSEIHFDLALVRYCGDDYFLYSYIKDVDLLF
jgi:Holliday junction resolvase-like predicted endonuclease